MKSCLQGKERTSRELKIRYDLVVLVCVGCGLFFNLNVMHVLECEGFGESRKEKKG